MERNVTANDGLSSSRAATEQAVSTGGTADQPTSSRAATGTSSGNRIATALYVNAGLLGLILLVLVARGPGASLPSVLPAAFAQPGPGIAGGAGVFIMPGQFSSNVWGVYLLDVDSQTLAAYVYLPGQRQLQLVAARTYRYDRRLTNFNTAAPSPDEVRSLLEREARPMIPVPAVPGGAGPAVPGEAGTSPRQSAVPQGPP